MSLRPLNAAVLGARPHGVAEHVVDSDGDGGHGVRGVVGEIEVGSGAGRVGVGV